MYNRNIRVSCCFGEKLHPLGFGCSSGIIGSGVVPLVCVCGRGGESGGSGPNSSWSVVTTAAATVTLMRWAVCAGLHLARYSQLQVDYLRPIVLMASAPVRLPIARVGGGGVNGPILSASFFFLFFYFFSPLVSPVKS